MAVTMLDTDQATYPAPAEADSLGFPVTGDTITIAESSGGTVVSMTQPGDGTVVFAAVAPGTVQVSWTDGALSFTDTIDVTAGAAASLVVGAAGRRAEAGPGAALLLSPPRPRRALRET